MFAGQINPGQLGDRPRRSRRTPTPWPTSTPPCTRAPLAEYAFSATSGWAGHRHRMRLEIALDGTDRLRNIEKAAVRRRPALNIIVGTPRQRHAERHGQGRPDPRPGRHDTLNGLRRQRHPGRRRPAARLPATLCRQLQHRQPTATTTAPPTSASGLERRPTTAVVATGGQIRIDDGNNVLRFFGGTTARTRRRADHSATLNLAGATSATISYRLRSR